MKSKKTNIHLPLIFLFLIILFSIIIRVRLLDVPLERDEGEYAYIGQLILEGTPPYTEAYNMKFPGIYFIYAGILWLFGETNIAIHFCLLVVNLLSIILLYIFCRIAYDDWVGSASACAFALLSMSYHVQGFWANAEHFILPFVIGANILLLYGIKKSRMNYILLAGVLFGCAALVKQHGAFFGLFGFAALFILLWQNKVLDKKVRLKYILAYIAGVIGPLLLFFIYFYYIGILEKFYLWTFIYAKEYTLLIPLIEIKYNFIGGFQSVFYFASLIWIISGVGFIALFSKKYRKEPNILIFGLLAASIIAPSIGFYFRPHYFILALPIVALLFGIGIRFIFGFFSTASSPIVRYFPPVFIAVIAILGTIVSHWDVLIQFSPVQVNKIRYGYNPFPYSSMIAEILKDETSKEDRIAIIGNEPQFLFHSHRRSATSFIYTYSIVEEQPLAEQFRFEMIHQIESAEPKLLVYTHIKPEWYAKTRGEVELNKWFFDFSKLHYNPIARLEYNFLFDTLLIKDPFLLLQEPTHVLWITIYKKKDI
jgi:4-amino-4-deoxy-L-arabinose transferase-like glycosyltransferase